jgi:hypothetical protein
VKPLKNIIFVLIAFQLLISSCQRKDPTDLSEDKWVKRNISCAKEAVDEITRKIKIKIEEGKALQKTLTKYLTQKGCPLASHIECDPELGIQAIATYISNGKLSSKEKPKSPADDTGDNSGGSLNNEFKNFTNSKFIKNKYAGKTKKGGLKGNKIVDTSLAPKVKLEQDTGLSPDFLAQKSGCGVKVTKDCSFLKLDYVISKMVSFNEQVVKLENEIEAILILTHQLRHGAIQSWGKLDGQDIKMPSMKPGLYKSIESIKPIYAALKTLENQTRELVTRESLAARKKGAYLEFYNSLKPLKIKGIIIDLTKVVPVTITSRLSKYLPKLKKGKKFISKNEESWKSKQRRSIKNLSRSKREYANMCLRKTKCWQFRSCVQRFKLPGIPVFGKKQ